MTIRTLLALDKLWIGSNVQLDWKKLAALLNGNAEGICKAFNRVRYTFQKIKTAKNHF